MIASTGPKGGQVVTETTTEKSPPDWRAAAWSVERQQQLHFGPAPNRLS